MRTIVAKSYNCAPFFRGKPAELTISTFLQQTKTQENMRSKNQTKQKAKKINRGQKYKKKIQINPKLWRNPDCC